MKRLRKWLLWAAAAMIVAILVILSPVAYVEMACSGDGSPRPYKPILGPQHQRAETRTLMTYPEWHIVHAYEDYARVISVGDPHDFHYLRSIRGFWSSLCNLSEASARLGEVDVETKQMIYVIGVSFSMELALKAAYEETIGRIAVWLRGEARAPLDDLSAQQAEKYAAFLQQVPWYKWNFREDAQELRARATASLRDQERRIALGLEYMAKAAYAEVIAAAVASTGADELTLRMLVAGSDSAKLSGVEGVKLIDTSPDGIVIEVPRYRALTHLLSKLAQAGFDFIEIAGNDQILFTALSADKVQPNSLASMERQGFGDYRHLIMVDVRDLAARLRDLESSNMTLEHIHDY